MVQEEPSLRPSGQYLGAGLYSKLPITKTRYVVFQESSFEPQRDLTAKEEFKNWISQNELDGTVEIVANEKLLDPKTQFYYVVVPDGASFSEDEYKNSYPNQVVNTLEQVKNTLLYNMKLNVRYRNDPGSEEAIKGWIESINNDFPNWVNWIEDEQSMITNADYIVSIFGSGGRYSFQNFHALLKAQELQRSAFKQRLHDKINRHVWFIGFQNHPEMSRLIANSKNEILNRLTYFNLIFHSVDPKSSYTADIQERFDFNQQFLGAFDIIVIPDFANVHNGLPGVQSTQTNIVNALKNMTDDHLFMNVTEFLAIRDHDIPIRYNFPPELQTMMSQNFNIITADGMSTNTSLQAELQKKFGHQLVYTNLGKEDVYIFYPRETNLVEIRKAVISYNSNRRDYHVRNPIVDLNTFVETMQDYSRFILSKMQIQKEKDENETGIALNKNRVLIHAMTLGLPDNTNSQTYFSKWYKTNPNDLEKDANVRISSTRGESDVCVFNSNRFQEKLWFDKAQRNELARMFSDYTAFFTTNYTFYSTTMFELYGFPVFVNRYFTKEIDRDVNKKYLDHDSEIQFYQNKLNQSPPQLLVFLSQEELPLHNKTAFAETMQDLFAAGI